MRRVDETAGAIVSPLATLSMLRVCGRNVRIAMLAAHRSSWTDMFGVIESLLTGSHADEYFKLRRWYRHR